MGNLIEQQAIDFSNVPIIQRGVKASVHLEDWEDVLFWDTMIQRVSPGRYNYLAHSKADNGHQASGSSQCLKYKGYMSKQFFACIDSDMNYLLQTANINADHYIAQTYTYSWENHYAEANGLQARFASVLPALAQQFDFRHFLSEYSKIVYHPLLALLYCLRNKDSRLSRKDFATCLPHQCKAVELLDNGKGILSRISNDLVRMMNSSGVLSDIDFVAEETRYFAMGLTEDNAYLRVRGHNLYDLLKSIGHQLCSAQQVDFENQILNASVPSEGSYLEIDCSAGDLRQILI